MLMKPAGLRQPIPVRADEPTPVGINVGIGAVLIIVAAMIAAAVPATDSGWREGIVLAAVGVFAAATVDQVALAGVVALAWLVVNGFLIDRFGQLSWHGSSDLRLIMLLVLVGTAGLLAGQAYRQVTHLRESWRAEAEWQGTGADSVADTYEEERRDA